MKCKNCESTASVFLTQIVEGKFVKVNFCDPCAESKGVKVPSDSDFRLMRDESKKRVLEQEIQERLRKLQTEIKAVYPGYQLALVLDSEDKIEKVATGTFSDQICSVMQTFPMKTSEILRALQNIGSKISKATLYTYLYKNAHQRFKSVKRGIWQLA